MTLTHIFSRKFSRIFFLQNLQFLYPSSLCVGGIISLIGPPAFEEKNFGRRPSGLLREVFHVFQKKNSRTFSGEHLVILGEYLPVFQEKTYSYFRRRPQCLLGKILPGILGKDLQVFEEKSSRSSRKRHVSHSPKNLILQIFYARTFLVFYEKPFLVFYRG